GQPAPPSARSPAPAAGRRTWRPPRAPEGRKAKWRRRGPPSLLPHVEGEFAVLLAVRHELVPGLLREALEILDRAGIGREHLQHVARAHVGERLFRTQDGKGAVQPARVEFLGEIHVTAPLRGPKYMMQ